VFRRRGAAAPSAGPARAAAGASKSRGGKPKAAARIRFLAAMLVGVALMGGAGYLVAALLIFPAPLLPNEREVARVMGLGVEDARRRLEAAGLAVELARAETHWSWPQGVVVWQDPPPGVALPSGDTVSLVVSAGPPRSRVPDVAGLDFELARRLVWAAGFNVEGADSVEGGGFAPGVAVATTPASGDSAALGRGVVIHVAR
jgi:serine/threonine-protein kinase